MNPEERDNSAAGTEEATAGGDNSTQSSPKPSTEGAPSSEDNASQEISGEPLPAQTEIDTQEGTSNQNAEGRVESSDTRDQEPAADVSDESGNILDSKAHVDPSENSVEVAKDIQAVQEGKPDPAVNVDESESKIENLGTADKVSGESEAKDDPVNGLTGSESEQTTNHAQPAEQTSQEQSHPEQLDAGADADGINQDDAANQRITDTVPDDHVAEPTDSSLENETRDGKVSLREPNEEKHSKENLHNQTEGDSTGKNNGAAAESEAFTVQEAVTEEQVGDQDKNASGDSNNNTEVEQLGDQGRDVSGSINEPEVVNIAEDSTADQGQNQVQSKDDKDGSTTETTSTPLIQSEAQPSNAVQAADDLIADTMSSTQPKAPVYPRQYMGGYRNRNSGVEYYHCTTQTITPHEIKAMKAAPKFHRDTQTKFVRNRQSQSYAEKATQMSNRGVVYISTESDQTRIQPRKYLSAEQYDDIVISCVIQIQCFIRRCMARRFVARKRAEKNSRQAALAAKETRRKKLAEKAKNKEIESRLHPKTAKDFEILYNGLENWRMQETEKINNSGYNEPARLTALADLLDQEAALIQKIDRLKIVASEENRQINTVRLLDKMASPKKWPVHNTKGGYTSVDTPNTIRARELRDLYHALNIPLLSVDERLQILLHVKYTVKEFDCNLTRDIVELIDREGDLVSRGREAKSLEGLRKRISNLFLQFIRTPEFNPEAKLHQKFPNAGQAWKRDQAVYYCRGCTKYLASTDFYLSTTLSHLGRCKQCTMKENIAVKRKDDTCYVEMLKVARGQEVVKTRPKSHERLPEEAHYNAISLLQESDVRYLVDAIWNRQSAVSGSNVIEDLVLTRWDPTQELSPWNVILLTNAEAMNHDQQIDPRDVYSFEFIQKVHQRHLAARQHFSQLPYMSKYMARNYVESFDGKLVPRTKNSSTEQVKGAVNSLEQANSLSVTGVNVEVL